MQMTAADVLVIGSGAAGLYAAIRAAESGSRVTLWEKGLVGRSGGTVSGAGPSAVGPWSDPQDSEDVHFRDTVIGGSYLSDQPLARILSRESQDRIRELEQWGIRFDRNPDGSYIRDVAGGHSYPRVMAISDRVGLQMIKVLRTQVERLGVRINADTMTTRLLVEDGRIQGALGIDFGRGEMVGIRAPAVVLATGGVGQLYPVTSNPLQVTGDGLALALTAGARLINMEQVQFFPCGLVHPPSLKGFILGIQEYAHLYNSENERFMGHYEPDHFEHTTRDRLARGIHAEIRAGRGSEHGGVYLDTSHLAPEIFKSFMHEIEISTERGYDYRRQRVEVAPSAHYFMGGVEIDIRAGASVSGLFAAGEVSGGVQGGNRLSGNALSELLVFGSRAGEHAADYARSVRSTSPCEEQLKTEAEQQQKLLQRPRSELTPARGKVRLQDIMNRHMGVVRTAGGLNDAERELLDLTDNLLPEICINGSGLHYNQSLQTYLELEKMVAVAGAMVAAAQTRKESRGAHYREDFPDWDTSQAPQCTLNYLAGEKISSATRPAQLTEIQPPQSA